MDLKAIIELNRSQSIRMKISQEKVSEYEIGSSKFGGNPDLPPDFDWYYFTGKSQLDDSTKKRPLSFLAQIDCKEISQFDEESKLPSHGMLYFFYELESMPWGYDPKDRGSSRVYYFKGDMSNLERTTAPIDLDSDFILPEAKIDFEVVDSVPSFEELVTDNSVELWDEYDEILESMNLTPDENISKLLGYANVIQDEMTLECELVTNDIYCGDADYYTEENKQKYKVSSRDWNLLLQLDTVSFEDYELMFGDCGRIYFYIKNSDLTNHNFDKTWLILQC